MQSCKVYLQSPATCYSVRSSCAMQADYSCFVQSFLRKRHNVKPNLWVIQFIWEYQPSYAIVFLLTATHSLTKLRFTNIQDLPVRRENSRCINDELLSASLQSKNTIENNNSRTRSSRYEQQSNYKYRPKNKYAKAVQVAYKYTYILFDSAMWGIWRSRQRNPADTAVALSRKKQDSCHALSKF